MKNSQTKHRITVGSQSGTALLFVMILLSVVSFVVIGAGVVFDNNMNNANLTWTRKSSFYVAEAMRHVTMNITREYFSKTVIPRADELRREIEARLPGILLATSPDFHIEHPTSQDIGKVDLELVGSGAEAPIPNGPFVGMSSPQYAIRVKYNVVRKGDAMTGAVSKVDMMVSLSQIALTQFYKFFSSSALHRPARRTEERGHIHINGDYCVGAATEGVFFQRLTIAGRLMHANDPRCPIRSGTDASLAYIATDRGFTTFARLTNDADNSCANCGGTGADWSTFVRDRFNGQAGDKDSGVQVLTLPNTTSAKVQVRWDQNGYRDLPRSPTEMRFVIDPVRSSDPDNIKQQKLALRADVRVLDGVWYLRDAADPNAWPGLPIWSDHPGRAEDIQGRPIGQDDIADFWAARGRPWSSGTPKSYSYYEYDKTTRTVASDTTGVVSYGTLARAPTGYVPGYWLDSLASSAPLCRGVAATACDDPAGNGGCGVLSAFGGLTCPAGNAPAVGTLLLKGSRSGFVNGYFQANSQGTPTEQRERGHILPMNFDVAQFQAALANTGPGELGSYFSGTFNGIVYLSSSWKGSMNGFDDYTAPGYWPPQGALADAAQMPTTSTAEQQALPYQLCSDPSVVTPGGLAGQPFDETAADGTSRFRIPDCTTYESDLNPTGTSRALVNAVRLVNGRTIAGTHMPKGLSVVSNLPVYLVGDYNTSSDVSNATATPWVSTLVAGGKIYQISNNWTDERAPWGRLWNEIPRPATSTVYQTALLGASGQNLMEDWRLQTLNTAGSSA